jgi:hypothetical protein
MHPTYDAVGRAVVDASNLEFWFNLLASGLTDLDYVEVGKADRKALKTKIRRVAEGLPDPSGPELVKILSSVWSLFETRDAIVHGGLTATDETGQVLVSRRPPRDRVTPMTVHPRWPDMPFPKDKVRKFTRETLVEFSWECQGVFDTIQANLGRWSGDAVTSRGERDG